jgi:hypothetical protein
LAPVVLFAIIPYFFGKHLPWAGVLEFTALTLFAAFLSPIPWQWGGPVLRSPARWQGLLQSLFLAFMLGVATTSFLRIFQPARLPLFKDAFGFIAFFGFAFLLVGWPTAAWEGHAQEARRAQDEARGLQWMGQRGEFSPRLLLDTLESLIARGDCIAAEAGMLDLAELYRTWLQLSERPLVTLEAERQLVDRYLALEAHYIGRPMMLRWEMDAHLVQHRLPPLILQPLVEALLNLAPPNTSIVIWVGDRDGRHLVEMQCPALAAAMMEQPVWKTTAQRLSLAYGIDVAMTGERTRTAFLIRLPLAAS